MFDHDTNRLLRRISEQLDDVLWLLKHPPQPQRNIIEFSIRSTTMLPIAPGFSPQFTATPIPAGAFPAPGNVPAWTTSDPTNAPITVDPTGLVATVAIPATAVVGTTVTLSISYTNADSTVATGSTAFTIVAPPPPDITGFTIAQTA
jgi:hypothetical protein